MRRLYGYLGENVCKILRGLPSELADRVCEVRLRAGGALSLSTYSKNILVTERSEITSSTKDAYKVSAAEITQTVSRLSEGSVYRYMSTINKGYIVTREGIRVGVLGQAIVENGKISSVTTFTSVNMRLHREIEGVGDPISLYLTKNPQSSAFIYSPPGYGKTTVIRSVAQALATGRFAPPVRVSVIDERGEILPRGAIGLIDRFLGYSKPDGIEIATRLFSPQYIVCDEIGLFDDTEAILSVENSGVPFIATSHGSSFSEILLRPNIKKLIDHGIFDTFIRLSKKGDGLEIEFEESGV